MRIKTDIPFHLVRRGKIDLLECSIDAGGQSVFCITSRRGGVSFSSGDLNLSHGTGDLADHVSTNRLCLTKALECTADEIGGLRQVHSTKIIEVDESSWQSVYQRSQKADGMITRLRSRWLAISIGDCVPIAIFDPARKILCMLHAGWAGTANRIVEVAVKKLQDDFGVDPEKLWAVVGPGAGQSVYQVDDLVSDAFKDRWENWQQFCTDRSGEHAYLDLQEANKWLLMHSGIPDSRITKFDLCTHTLSSLFFSHRRDGLPGGRMFALGLIK